MSSRIALFLLCAFAHFNAVAATLSVGPNGTHQRISDAARDARDGDTVEIAEGEYRGDAAIWTQGRLTIRGLGKGATLIADGAIAEGKAVWVIRSGEFDIGNITFRGARAPDNNGAGIRFEHGLLRVANCRFFDNQNGILTSNDKASELIVTNSEFGDSPHSERGLPHLLYVGQIARLEVTGSNFYKGWKGHLLKSRARESVVKYNKIYDGSDGAASYELEFPVGGQAVVVGNIIGQSRDTQNSSIVAYGAEGRQWPENGLYLSHNTLVNNLPRGGYFLRVWREKFGDDLNLVALNNLLIGNGEFNVADEALTGNVRLRLGQSGAPVPPDFRLAADSPLRGKIFKGAATPFGDLAPQEEFTPPSGVRPLAAPARAPGAVQTPARQ
ncbi:MAG: right-handed parallel beta-helix repeat-containing protein [Azoarcus sp.]|jgi:hypothetical protein|nr:right-handed parallel beta-helix repeat-containing protein [Azoarcus sp.]